MSGLLLTGIGHLTTHDGDPITDAVVAIDGTTITYAGGQTDSPAQEGRELVDCGGRAVIPGFVDAHTHLVFAGDRSDEFARRLSGESYADIAAAGGGILSTVSATRSASEDQLFDLAAARVWNMIRSGTTTLEIKSGYGLDLETELRLLRVARRIGEELPVTVRATFLGAHAASGPGSRRFERRGTYVRRVVTRPARPAATQRCRSSLVLGPEIGESRHQELAFLPALSQPSEREGSEKRSRAQSKPRKQRLEAPRYELTSSPRVCEAAGARDPTG